MMYVCDFAYDFLGGKTEQVEITDRHDAESLRHFRLQKGDIAVLDAGYPVPTTVEEADTQGIDVVLRATESHQAGWKRRADKSSTSRSNSSGKPMEGFGASRPM